MTIFQGIFHDPFSTGSGGTAGTGSTTVIVATSSAQWASPPSAANAPIYLYPLFFTGSTARLHVTTNGTGELLSMSVDTGDRYFASGDLVSGSHKTDIGYVLQTILDNNTQGGTYVVSMNSQNQFIVSCSVSFIINASTSSALFPQEFLGIYGSLAGTNVGTGSQTAGSWRPRNIPAFDSYDEPMIVAERARTSTNKMRGYDLSPPGQGERTQKYIYQERERVVEAFATCPSSSLEMFYRQGIGPCELVRFYPDASIRTTGSYSTYRFLDADRPWDRNDDKLVMFSCEFRMTTQDEDEF